MEIDLESLRHSTRLNEIIKDASLALANSKLQGWELTDSTDCQSLSALGVRVSGLSGARNYLVLGNGSYDVDVNFNKMAESVVLIGDYPNGLTARIGLEGAGHEITLSGSNRQHNILKILIHGNKGAFYCGRNTRILDLSATLEGGSEITIGGGCLIASRVQMRTTDSHAIFDLSGRQRINQAKNISIGSDVWLAEDCLLLKGATIGSGSILGARSVLSGKTIPNCSLAVGNPARVIRQNVGWTFELFPSSATSQAMLEAFQQYL
jgi:hypothetical protein